MIVYFIMNYLSLFFNKTHNLSLLLLSIIRSFDCINDIIAMNHATNPYLNHKHMICIILENWHVTLLL